MIELLGAAFASMTVVAVLMHVDFAVFAVDQKVDVSLGFLIIVVDESGVNRITESKSAIIDCNSYD